MTHTKNLLELVLWQRTTGTTKKSEIPFSVIVTVTVPISRTGTEVPTSRKASATPMQGTQIRQCPTGGPII
jgi:hypothetical protein